MSLRLRIALGLLCSLLPVALAGCDSERIVEPPAHRPRLAVYGVFSPDQYEWRIEVTRTSPIGGPRGGAAVTDAVVVVTPEGGAPFALVYKGGGFYTSTAPPPAPSQRFRLRVEAPGLPAATADGEVPLPVENLSVRLEQRDSLGVEGGRAVLALSFADAPGRDDAYQVVPTIDNGRTMSVSFTSAHPAFSRARLEDAVGGDVGRPQYAALFDDQSFRGRPFVASLSVIPALAYAYGVDLEHLSQPVYLFRRSQDAVAEAEGANLPFSEPVVPYTNVSGGVGVFGGLVRQSASVVVDEITRARVVGTYESSRVYRPSSESQQQRNWDREGARLTLTLGAGGQVSGTRVWPEPGWLTTAPLVGTYRLERGLLQFEADPLIDDLECVFVDLRRVRCTSQMLIVEMNRREIQ